MLKDRDIEERDYEFKC